MAPKAQTYIVRVFDDDRKFYDFADGTTYSTDLIAAATICKEWGADIINVSLGGSNYDEIEEKFFSDLFYESGILTVAASGNGGNTQHVYPAAYDGVLSVGAVDESLTLAKFSSWDSSTTDVLAPGKSESNLVCSNCLKLKFISVICFDGIDCTSYTLSSCSISGYHRRQHSKHIQGQ